MIASEEVTSLMTPPALIYVFARSPETTEALRAVAFSHLVIRAFASAGELLDRCRLAPPLLVVAEVGSDTDLTPLARLAELPTPPRRLCLVEPAALEELMSEAFRLGSDHAQLWPCTADELRIALAHALTSAPSAAFPTTPHAADLDLGGH